MFVSDPQQLIRTELKILKRKDCVLLLFPSLEPPIQLFFKYWLLNTNNTVVDYMFQRWQQQYLLSHKALLQCEMDTTPSQDGVWVPSPSWEWFYNLPVFNWIKQKWKCIIFEARSEKVMLLLPVSLKNSCLRGIQPIFKKSDYSETTLGRDHV